MNTDPETQLRAANLMDEIVKDTDALKALTRQTKELRTRINNNKETLMEMMKESGTNQLTLHNTVIRITNKKRTKAPTLPDVFEYFEEELRDNEQTTDVCETIVDQVKNKVNGTREEQQVETLTLTKAK